MTNSEDKTTGNSLGSSAAAPLTDTATSNQPTDFVHVSQSWDASPGTGAGGSAITPIEYAASADEGRGSNAEAAQTKRVREVLSDAQAIVQRNYRVASDTANDFVHDNPWQAITMAAFGGLVVGMLINR